MTDQPDSTNTNKGVLVRIDWHIPESIKSRYANNVIVQHTEHEFIISFFEVVPPIIIGSDEERTDQLSRVDSVQAECVARIVVPATRFPEFVQAFGDNWDRFIAKQEDLP